MPRRRRAPNWLTRRMLDALHDAQLRDHGGAPGVRDEGLLESALARPQQKWAYAKPPDLATPAAAYAFGLAKNHGYVDGNKRVAFMAAYVFLGLNGKDLDAAEPDVATVMNRLAAGRTTETALADWFRSHVQPLR
jgi:death on curing protein